MSQKTVSGPWIDRTGMYRAKQNPLNRAKATPAHFTTVYTITLIPPPLWETMDSGAYHQHCVDLAQGAIKSAQVKRKGKSIGMARVLVGGGRSAPVSKHQICICLCMCLFAWLGVVVRRSPRRRTGLVTVSLEVVDATVGWVASAMGRSRSLKSLRPDVRPGGRSPSWRP